ncbi:uncharacterized protein LOC133033724 [Cannabis sativa]|uniref:uncharacterized protein LOC133033724 n=1 Tax=Cannabis sativa TaxID=3483 RepID=UPI0029CAA095|nr:uncharacterized protein LOC133033724 [Cannabis sativa]
MRTLTCQKMGIQEAGENSLYLGLPCTIGRNKNAVFDFVKDKVCKRILSWEGRFLSKAGKELLLKTVAQAIPNHAMSVFLLPMKTYLRQYNIALLGKQSWRLLVHESALVTRVFKARYFPKSSFLAAPLGNNPSYVWRSLFETKNLMLAGVRKSIASGLQTPILDVPWLPHEDCPFVQSDHPALANQLVSSLMCINDKQWDMDIIKDLFNERDQRLILSIPLPLTVHEDCWSWSKEKTGFYSVKSAYRWLRNQSIPAGVDSGL